jgi:ankyrin repeat protein
LPGVADAGRRLRTAGGYANARDDKWRTALMLAARRGDAALIRLLLDAGADAQRRDSEGLSAADHATQSGQTAVLPLLP